MAKLDAVSPLCMKQSALIRQALSKHWRNGKGEKPERGSRELHRQLKFALNFRIINIASSAYPHPKSDNHSESQP